MIFLGGIFLKVVKRTEKLPMYIFSRFESIKKELMKKGIEIIDLSIGDPEMDTPDYIIDGMIEALKEVKNYGYPPYRGTDGFKKAVADYYYKNFGVELDYENEVAALIGSKEGIAHLILGMADEGDYVLVPDPGYPVYNSSSIISGCNVYKMNLYEGNAYLPDIDIIEKSIIDRSKILLVNYPNNPTGAVANKEFYKKLIEFGKKNNIVIANDGAYMDICSHGIEPLSLLQIDGAKDIGVEFGSLSKSYNMTGWRLGFVVGNKEVINQLMIVKTNFDSGQFSAIQRAGEVALEKGKDTIEKLIKIYDERREIITNALRSIDIKVYDSKGTFYVWFKNPEGYSSEELANKILEEIGVMITPGNAFGYHGEGYCRISLTTNNDDLTEVARRLSNLIFN